jgi:hypothetical protein
MPGHQIKRVRSFRVDPDDLRRLRAAYPNPSEGLRQAVRFLVRLEDALAERLRAWTETLARLTGRAVPPFRVPVRFDPPARAWDGRDWVSAAALWAWAADRATRQAGIPVLENPHDVAAVWGLHVGRALGLDEPRARALGGFCHEWLGAWADLSGEAREGADLALRVFASVLEGRIEPPTTLRLPPPPRRLFPTVAAEDPAYARAWRAVLRVLELMQAGRIRRLPFRDTETWLLDGVPVDARAVLEAEGIDPAPAAGPRTFPARVHLFWYMPEGYRWNLEDPSVRAHVFFQVATRGTDADIVELLRALRPEELLEAFRRTADRLPTGVRRFWDEFLSRSADADPAGPPADFPSPEGRSGGGPGWRPPRRRDGPGPASGAPPEP